ncbi:histidine kinase dimerization/phospho-acceptor domain-containing protein [Streptomyces durmitorensis]|uniref:histidine kinase n=1 Tax=Streptomyces durmitorensis TaxID=319947 RepID=A0ABY4Q0H6_9ACTN|nr:HAMP domain-containing sensor histidine kinase [Streptomyces durmitorensis]UQT58692.1 HAMP domain-containing histidine kinase [Streptomyces durmitorensis]
MKGIARRARGALNALGLRWKIAALLALGCAVVAVAIGILVHQARLEQVSTGARSGATAQLVRVRQLYELTGQVDTAGDDGTEAAIDAPGLPASLRSAALDGQRTTYLDMGAADPVVWAARPVGDHVLSVREPLAQQAAEMAEFDQQLVVSGAVVVILAALGGAALASRLSRELRTAAATARRISQGDLDARIDHPRPPGGRDGRRGKDEVAELAAAVDTMAASLQQRIEAEQRFTADVAHELRTPLTGLHTAAELLPQSRPTELVRDRVLALRTLTEDLLEVARLDAEVERPDLDAHPLGTLTEGIVQRAGCPVRFVAACGLDDTLVRTDARRLERIIANLVANARRHGAGSVDVRVAGPVVTVSDQGPGFPEHLLKDGPQRFQTGARERGQGTGLGLTIAFGQAQVIGARVELRNAEGGGAVASVHLPEA